MDGRHALPDEEAADRCHRDVPARARLQSHLCHQHPGPEPSDGSDAGLSGPIRAHPIAETPFVRSLGRATAPYSLGGGRNGELLNRTPASRSGRYHLVLRPGFHTAKTQRSYLNYCFRYAPSQPMNLAGEQP